MATIKSIEEKAKAYDNLLVRLQEAKVDNDICDERYCCVIDNIVPELKESEDERIRKHLIKHFGNKSKTAWNGMPVDKILAWLKEQGQTFTKKDVDDAYLRGISDAKHELEKQGEQKHQYKSRPRYVGETELLGSERN